DASTNGQGFSSIGYFDAGFSDFPINRGIVMATGNAKSTEGPATSTSYGGSWPGDSDLTDLIHEVEGSSFYDSNDATIIEFDFVSFANNVSFNFLFTSNEYGQYQCDYSDVFAFFLTDSDDNTENLAVVPGTTTPVSVTTIRDSQYNTGFDNCPSAN